MTDRCKFCGEPIQWALSEKKGKRMPVTAQREGSLILLPAEPGRLLPRATSVPAGLNGREIRTLRYVPHFAVCQRRAKRDRPRAGQGTLL